MSGCILDCGLAYLHLLQCVSLKSFQKINLVFRVCSWVFFLSLSLFLFCQGPFAKTSPCGTVPFFRVWIGVFLPSSVQLLAEWLKNPVLLQTHHWILFHWVSYMCSNERRIFFLFFFNVGFVLCCSDSLEAAADEASCCKVSPSPTIGTCKFPCTCHCGLPQSLPYIIT